MPSYHGASIASASRTNVRKKPIPSCFQLKSGDNPVWEFPVRKYSAVTEFRYKAFISYSHLDRRWAKWLLRKLEGYKIPKQIAGQKFDETKRRLGVFFRDREELPAASCLDSKIREAVHQSEFLIILCSPNAVGSVGVNAEIDEFVAHHGADKILCCIIGGEPGAHGKAPGHAEDCFPPSLRNLQVGTGRIPLAADAREIGDGKKAALQKLIAGLLGVGLNQLIRRENRRERKRLVGISVASVALAITMAGLALDSLAANRQAKIEQERAEELISFMLDDLVRNKLLKVGNLRIVDSVTKKLVDHYSQQDDSKLSPQGLSRKALTFSQLGLTYLRQNHEELARKLFEQALQSTSSLLARNPDDPEIIYSHMQALYFIAFLESVTGNYSQALNAFNQRAKLGHQLDGQDLRMLVAMELGNTDIHAGGILIELGRYQEAKSSFERGFAIRTKLLEQFPENRHDLENNLAGANHYMALANEFVGEPAKALEYAQRSNNIYQRLWHEDPEDLRDRTNLARSLRWLAETEVAVGDIDAAQEHLKQALVHHKIAIDFEPDDNPRLVDRCVSAVALADIFLSQKKFDAILPLFSAHCAREKELLAPTHFKVRQRLLGYRLELIRLERELNATSSPADMTQEIKTLYALLSKESSEIRHSDAGLKTILRFAIDAALVAARSEELPEADLWLKNTMAELAQLNQPLHPVVKRQQRIATALLAAQHSTE